MSKRSNRQYLKTHRRLWALTQRELGKLTGLTRQAISHYEQQMMRPSFEVALRLEIIFGTTPGHLFPALYERVEEEVMREAAVLREGLDKTKDLKKSRKKLALLDAMMKRATEAAAV